MVQRRNNLRLEIFTRKSEFVLTLSFMIKTRKRMLNFMTINIEQFDKDLCSKLFFFLFI